MTALVFVVLAFALGYRTARQTWKRRADDWFTRCTEAEAERFRMVPRFDVHPLYHATRSYTSIDALIRSAGGSARSVEGE